MGYKGLYHYIISRESTRPKDHKPTQVKIKPWSHTETVFLRNSFEITIIRDSFYGLEIEDGHSQTSRDLLRNYKGDKSGLRDSFATCITTNVLLFIRNNPTNVRICWCFTFTLGCFTRWFAWKYPHEYFSYWNQQKSTFIYISQLQRFNKIYSSLKIFYSDINILFEILETSSSKPTSSYL